MVSNRMTSAVQHLRGRLEQSAGVVCVTIRRNGATIHSNVPVVPMAYSRAVRIEKDSPTTVAVHAWIISVARIPAELLEGDLLTIGGKVYRIQKDDLTEQVWKYHGEHELNRVYFSVLWGVA